MQSNTVTLTAAAAQGAQQPVNRSRLHTDTVQLLIACTLIVLTGVLPEWLGSDYWTLSFQLVNLFIAVSAFQNLLMHDAGQTSFGQGAIFGVAAYGSAVMASMYGIPYMFAAGLGVLAAVLAGFLYALPALRVQSYYLGFVTMSAAAVFPAMLIAANAYTNGINGISMDFQSLHARSWMGVSPITWMVCCVACLALTAHVLLRRTALGRMLRVAAASPEAAQALGTSPGVMRCVAFMLVALGSGIVGTLYTPVVGFISPAAFNLDISILFFLAVIVGGRGHILGTVVGVWVLYLLPNILLAELAQYRLLVYGAVALVVMLLLPDGIIGTLERWRQRRNHVPQNGQSLSLERLLARGQVGASAKPKVQATESNAIEVHNAVRRYGAVAALDGVSLSVKRGHIHGLVGANGSGKTTLLNMLSGFSRLNSGAIHVQGKEVTRLAAHRIARLGLGRTFQKPRIFSTMSLWENVQIGVDAAQANHQPQEVLQALQAAMEGGDVELVPHGQRRLVELMRVVLQGSDIILLDEPAAGLSPSEREQFKQLLIRLRDEMGKTIVIVEHDLDLVWNIANVISVLETGKLVAHGRPQEISSNSSVRKLFIGADHA